MSCGVTSSWLVRPYRFHTLMAVRMTMTKAGGSVPPDDRDDTGGVVRLLITRLFMDTPPGSWTPVCQLIALIIVTGGVLTFFVQVVRGDSVGTAEVWRLVGLGTGACGLGFALMRWISRRHRWKKQEKQDREDALRAARRQSPPVEPAAPLAGDTTQKADDQNREDQT